ncbi:uncharacterized protein BXZ73DRAFT_105126 [Epithele typhae]|uniref:uncharacterized protein n=1 Tax=Epithele typhae TaxID=378194 RepID=UPI002008B323|nr:uncharacterized protein BXZ73DRAFT_105126 [Epithele typhae]KAH9918729.1 hypothetical protein BXZ73DRAFT_105126 [Epithele typhae]
MTSAARTTFGPFFIGVFLDIACMGILSGQVFLYYSSYKQDRVWLKAVVVVLFMLEIADTTFDTLAAYEPLIIHFDPLFNGIIAAIVQAFYAWRIRKLTHNTWVAALIFMISLASLAGSVATFVSMTRTPAFDTFRQFETVVILWLVCGAVADILITMVSVWHLRSKKTGMSVTDNIINRITRMSLETGLLTSVWALTDLILFLVVPQSIHLTLNLTLSKLYTISLLSSLISRQALHRDASNGPRSGSNGSGGLRARGVAFLRREPSTRSAPEIFVDVESHERVDNFEYGKDHIYGLGGETAKGLSKTDLSSARTRDSSKSSRT